jgi:large subunit ribosomal protein L6
MSRVGKAPIPIPDKVKVAIDGGTVTVIGPKGSLSKDFPVEVTVAIEDKTIVVTRSSDLKKNRALHGMTRALINNMVIGVTQGFKRELEIIGVGYRAEMRGKNLVLYLGYSHPTVFSPPDEVSLSVQPKENKIAVTGTDKQLVGLVASTIRSFRKPEPYKGKGIRNLGEHIRTKAGKTAGA